MERNDNEVIENLNSRFAVMLDIWKKEPQNQFAIRSFNETLSLVDKEKVNLRLKIFGSILSCSEGKRAILPSDLKKWTRREGEFVVFEFHAKRGDKANSKVRVVNLGGSTVLAILNNEYGSYGLEASFFPNEIASLDAE